MDHVEHIVFRRRAADNVLRDGTRGISLLELLDGVEGIDQLPSLGRSGIAVGGQSGARSHRRTGSS